MGKDNSCSKSKLQIQRERMNEELLNFNCSITKGLRSIEDNIKVEEKAKWILGLYNESVIKMEGKLLVTEKNVVLNVENCINLSEYEKTLRQAKEGLNKNQYKELKNQYIETIRPQIINRMKSWLEVVFRKLNDVVEDYNFYLKSIEIDSICFEESNLKLQVSLGCKIDIM